MRTAFDLSTLILKKFLVLLKVFVTVMNLPSHLNFVPSLPSFSNSNLQSTCSPTYRLESVVNPDCASDVFAPELLKLRPPRNEGELLGFLDDSVFATGEVDGLSIGARYLLALCSDVGVKLQLLGQLNDGAADLAMLKFGQHVGSGLKGSVVKQLSKPLGDKPLPALGEGLVHFGTKALVAA